MTLKIDNLYIQFALFVVLVLPGFALPGAETIFISEVLFDPDSTDLKFIELYNREQSSRDLDGWTIEVLDESMDVITLPEDAVIPGYGFYLIGCSTDEEDWSAKTYPPDFYADADLDFYDDRGAVELIDNTLLTVDKLGWGDCSQGYYEHEPYPMPSEGYSLERKSGPTHNEMGGNSYDTDNNSNDFRDRSNPDPQNITSIPEKPQLNVEGMSWGYIRAMYSPE